MLDYSSGNSIRMLELEDANCKMISNREIFKNSLRPFLQEGYVICVKSIAQTTLGVDILHRELLNHELLTVVQTTYFFKEIDFWISNDSYCLVFKENINSKEMFKICEISKKNYLNIVNAIQEQEHQEH